MTATDTTRLTRYSIEDARKIEDAMNKAISTMQALGADIEDPADIKCLGNLAVSALEDTIVVNEFCGNIELFLKTLRDCKIRTIRDLIR
jgi:hypothetical protein